MLLFFILMNSYEMTEQLLKEMFVQYYYINMEYYPEELQNLYGENSTLCISDSQYSVSSAF